MDRFVSWNLNERPGGSGKAWEYMRDTLRADLAAVQEAIVPRGVQAAFRASGIAGRDGKSRPWGSAVAALSERARLTPIGLAEGVWRGRSLGLAPLDCVSRGHVAIARVEFPAHALTVISAYGLMEFGYASGSLLRTIADLEPLFDDPELGDNVLLSGDWNIGTWWSGQDDAKFARREGAALALLEAYGLIDCLDKFREEGRLEHCPCELGESCRHIWTMRKPGVDTAYMDDYVFATQALAERISSARVADSWDWNPDLSDHAPLVVYIA